MLTDMDGTSATTIDRPTLDEILSVASPEKIILFGSAVTGTMTVDRCIAGKPSEKYKQDVVDTDDGPRPTQGELF